MIDWRHVRTINALERAFPEGTRRSGVSERFPNQMAALAVIFGILEEERLKWRRATTKPEDIA